jgi:hypothetical protein
MADLPALWTYSLLVSLGVTIATYGTLISRIMAGGLLLIGIRLVIRAFETWQAVVERLGFGRLDRQSNRGGQPCSAKCC